MQLTRHTDFALRTLIYLSAQQKDRLITMQELADKMNMPRNHLIKVVQNLGKHGYIKAVRGQGGGICLGRNATDINLGSVVRDMEKSLDPIDCAKVECPLDNQCELKGLLNQARNAFLAVLDARTLADIKKEPQQLDVLLRRYG